MSTDLIAWLREQLDADERITSIISGGGYAPDMWEIEPARGGRWSHVVAKSRTNIEPRDAAVREDHKPVAMVQSGRWQDKHIALWDPQRVTDEIAAKREVLAMYERAEAKIADYDQMSDSYLDGWCDGLQASVGLLARTYADRPGWREEWAA